MAVDLWRMFGPGVSAGAKIYGGFQANAAADYMAQNAEISGGQAMAAATQKAADEYRRSRLIQGDALARAAASGAGASDATVVDIISKIAGEGAYRSQLALYHGAEEQRAYQIRADNLRYEGKATRAAGIVNGLTGFGESFFKKYGGGGPVGLGYGTIDPRDAGLDLPY